MLKKNNILVTGGAGFIGSALCRNIIKDTNSDLIILDKLTYASNLNSIKSLINKKNVFFYEKSIGDSKFIDSLFLKHTPRYIFNLAAETHVDNSIINPSDFVKTNILDTHIFFNAVLKYYKNLPKNEALLLRLLHISTDEVYGDIKLNQPAVDEEAAYKPSSPYSASKASADHLVKSYYRTYGLPAIISNCSNNYGPFQDDEKFIPVIVKSLLKNKKIPIYGSGKQIREWIYVDEHCEALMKLIKTGSLGENYNIGSGEELSNIGLVRKIISLLFSYNIIKDDIIDNKVKFVTDRLGHDKRYALNSSKIKRLCDWKSKISIDMGLEKTIEYYLNIYDINNNNGRSL